MGSLIQFPPGEPEGEAPQVGYCASCGIEMSWPNDGSAWPQSCPAGCVPLYVQSWPPRADLFKWGIGQGPAQE